LIPNVAEQNTNLKVSWNNNVLRLLLL
jgi:hypothetical protein